MYMCRDYEQPLGEMSSDVDELWMAMAMSNSTDADGDDDEDLNARPIKCRRGAASGGNTSGTESDESSR
jgi:hypothetical protein